MVQEVRLSIGTAMTLGLEKGEPGEYFTTGFIMTHHEGKCEANCAFCPQARGSRSSSDRLSRIAWPTHSFTNVLAKLRETQLGRICIQCLNYDNVVDDTVAIIQAIREFTKTQISVCIHPVSKTDMQKIHDAGANNIGVAIDACTDYLFESIKGSEVGSDYRYETHLRTLELATDIFGKQHVTTHLIVGLGESEREAAEFILDMYSRGVSVGLFAFTPVQGTELEENEPPDLHVYRRIQVLRYLIAHRIISRDEVFYEGGEIRINMDAEELMNHLRNGLAFRVSGCPGCNRPYYNERPGGIMYNFPRQLNEDELTEAIEDTGMVT
ncbi:MAG: radical SAM protein [Candidatus Lokiarchaeota archaeon]|nr:radical SAM protein [Candidatus Lokiarchaeota archaeon]